MRRAGDTHWHPTQFWTSTVSCLIFPGIPLVKVLDELTNIFIVLPALTHSNHFQGTCTLPIRTIRYRVLLRKRHRDIFTIPRTTVCSSNLNAAKSRSDLVDIQIVLKTSKRQSRVSAKILTTHHYSHGESSPMTAGLSCSEE